MTHTSDSAATAFLRAATVYSPLPDSVLARLLERGSVRTYASGATVFAPGEESNEAFVVKSGVVEICRPASDGNGLNVVAYLGAGDSVGEMVLFTGSLRSSLARVPEGAEIFAIDRGSVIELCREEPDLALYFCRLFATRLESWVKKGRRSDGHRELQGNLRYFDLATILQTLGSSERTGLLTVVGPGGQVHAELDFEDGRLQFARLAHLRGEQALYQLFQPTPEGSFRFEVDERLTGDTGPRVGKSVLGLLMEAMRLQDEWAVARERFGDADCVFEPVGAEMAWDDDATFVAAFDVWTYLHRGVTLRQLVGASSHSEAVVLTVLARLAETGQIR